MEQEQSYIKEEILRKLQGRQKQPLVKLEDKDA